MKLTQFFILTMLMALSVKALSEEAVEQSPASATALVETTTEEPAKEEPKDILATCESGYSEFVKSLAKNKQQAEFETWWSYSDRQFNFYKTDEFKMKEERPKWQKAFDEMLKQTDSVYEIVPKVKIGQYDFKKKGFPIDIRIDAKEKIVQSYYSSSFSMGGLGVGTTDKTICSLMNQDVKKDNPSEVNYVIKNIDQLKFLSVSEDVAKKLTASLGSERLISMSLIIKPIKTQKITRKLGTFKFTKLVMDAKVQEASLSFDNEELKFNFK